MTLALNILLVFVGFFVLTFSAKQAMKRTVNISRYFGVSEFVISFILVGAISIFPELSIGVNSALSGNSSLGLGVIFGSNVADLTLVLGIVALFAGGIKIQLRTLRKSKWFLFAVILPVVMLLDGTLSRLDGFVLFASFVCYVVYMFSTRIGSAKTDRTNFNLYFEIFILFVSIAVLLLAGKVISDSAQNLGAALGVPLIFLGLLIAIGTCLPELMFAIQASESKHAESGFGDILGNVVTDCLATLGIIAMIQPITPALPIFAFIAGTYMVFSFTAVLYLLEENGFLSRRNGLILILLYFVFLAMQTALEYTLI